MTRKLTDTELTGDGWVKTRHRMPTGDGSLPIWVRRDVETDGGARVAGWRARVPGVTMTKVYERQSDAIRAARLAPRAER